MMEFGEKFLTKMSEKENGETVKEKKTVKKSKEKLADVTG